MNYRPFCLLRLLHGSILSGIVAAVQLTVALCSIGLPMLIPQALVAQSPAALTPLLRDTAINRGQTLELPIRVRLSDSLRQALARSEARFDSLRVVMRFTPQHFTLLRATGGGSHIMQCPVPSVDSVLTSSTDGLLIIRCSQLLRPQRDSVILCTLTLGTLVSSDSVGRISLESVTLNTAPLRLAPTAPARVIVRDSVFLFPDFPETLEGNAPNPMDSRTVFRYSINQPTEVYFSVFSSFGQEVASFEPVFRTRGRYAFEFLASVDVPQGLYYLRMRTRAGVYVRNFMIYR
jgi:hypothetical protein